MHPIEILALFDSGVALLARSLPIRLQYSRLGKPFAGSCGLAHREDSNPADLAWWENPARAASNPPRSASAMVTMFPAFLHLILNPHNIGRRASLLARDAAVIQNRLDTRARLQALGELAVGIANLGPRRQVPELGR